MQTSDSLIRTKLHLPSTRPKLVPRARLQEQLMQGLRVPLTLIIAPAGFGKTTLVACCVADCGMPVAWLSLDKDDNEVGRFLKYVCTALQETDAAIGSESVRLMVEVQQVSPQVILTSLINDIDSAGREIALVLDDYQFLSNQAVHDGIAFLLEHCPRPFHLVLVTRSDPPLPLARLRARAQTVELRAADLRFSESEAAQFLNEVMGLRLDAGSIAVLEQRTEGWVAGLQMAALSMRDRKDVLGFIEGFSGTNRYILDYLLEEVLASQPQEIQHFLLITSILERLTAPLCEALTSVSSRAGLTNDEGSQGEGTERSTYAESLFPSGSASILEYLERANLFLVPLDEERTWYRYHHLFADLLRTQLQKSLGEHSVARYHLRAAAWHEQNGSIFDAIHHASLASDEGMVERLIEQNYVEMMNRGEMSGVRSWLGTLSKGMMTRRPWVCLYEAFSHSWFGQLEEASLLLAEAEKRIRADPSAPDTQAMVGYHAYVKSRLTAMQGNTRQALELCLTARKNIPADSLALQIEVGITLGYEYFLQGEFSHADKMLHEMIQTCFAVGAINNPVAGYAILARLHAIQGQLHEAYDLFQRAAHLLPETGSQHLGAVGLVDVGVSALFYEWNELEPALARLTRGLNFLPSWGKADDLCLAYVTLSRIQVALGNQTDAIGSLEKAAQLIQTCSVFAEARDAVATSQVRLWLVQGDWPAVERWMSSIEKRIDSHDSLRYEDELTDITRARVFLAQKKWKEAIHLLSCLEESAESGGRTGRLIEILILKALALHGLGDKGGADFALMTSLTLAEPSGHRRVFLDEGQPLQILLTQWIVRASSNSLRSYGLHLLSQFDVEPRALIAQEKNTVADDLIEPLSQRELEVLSLMALGQTNQQIAQQLFIAPGTIKAHAASIYRKLNATNRTEAVAHARQVGILP